MKTISPKFIKPGMEIRVLALSESLSVVPKETRDRAKTRLEKLGYKVTFGKNAMKSDIFRSSSMPDRLLDFEAALADPQVGMILAATGGYNVNELLPYLDYANIRRARKLICGYSDITALLNAVYAKSGLITYLGPCFSTLGMKLGAEYTLDSFAAQLKSNVTGQVPQSKSWSDDDWQTDQNQRRFLKNSGPITLQTGSAEGVLIGGNLCTLNLLQGTDYLPALKNSILFIEDDDLVGKWFGQEFSRNFESLLQQAGANQISGVVFGRFQKGAKITTKKLQAIIKNKPLLKGLPILAGVDFGHTTPQFTLPIGGLVRIEVREAKQTITLIE